MTAIPRGAFQRLVLASFLMAGFAPAVRAGAAGQAPALPPITPQEQQERARYWMRKLRFAANPDETERIRNNLIALGDNAIPAIVAEADSGNLKDQLPVVHWNTCLILGKLGNDQAMPYLLRHLEPVSERQLKAQPEWTFVRAYAALSLGKIKDPARQAVVPLQKLYKDEQESLFLRRTACLALGTLRDTGSLAAFEKDLLDPKLPGTQRGALALALGMMQEDAAGAALAKYLKLKPEERHALADKMVVQAVGMRRKEGSWKDIAPLLGTEDPDLRGTTCLVLAWLGDRSVVPEIEKALKDEALPAFSRCNAAVALIHMGKPEEGAAYLREILTQKHDRSAVGTLAYAAVALGQVAGDDNLKCLHHVINESPFPVVVMNAINALGYRKDQRMAPYLIDRFTNLKGIQNEYIRGEIARALLSHAPEESIRQAMLQGLRDQSPYVRMRCAITLARYPGGDTEGALMLLLDDRDYQVIGEAALTLGVLKSKLAKEALYQLFKEENDWVRYRARKALENIILFGKDDFKQVAGLNDLIQARLQRVGAGIKDEMDRLYTVGYQQVLELDKPYKAGAKVW
ncbi:MAG: HEAT repeat domain-containing protein [Planctomycetota bacterium]|nr:HEAT repeat domain-containing protein [Planctomycetota bacterium]